VGEGGGGGGRGIAARRAIPLIAGRAKWITTWTPLLALRWRNHPRGGKIIAKSAGARLYDGDVRARLYVYNARV